RGAAALRGGPDARPVLPRLSADRADAAGPAAGHRAVHPRRARHPGQDRAGWLRRVVASSGVIETAEGSPTSSGVVAPPARGGILEGRWSTRSASCRLQLAERLYHLSPWHNPRIHDSLMQPLAILFPLKKRTSLPPCFEDPSMTLHTKIARHVSRRAFTLMEMLIVVAIIVALAGIGTFYILPQLNKSKEDTARVKATNVANALMTYYKDHNGTWPNSVEALTARDDYGGPYLQPDGILDPWGKEYHANVNADNRFSGAKPEVSTTTPDGKVIGNW